MLSKFAKIWKKALIMLSIGIVFSLIFQRDMNLTTGVFFSNILFICSMVFIVSGLYQLISNLGMFNSFVFGTKTLTRLFRSKLGPSVQVKDEYVDYIKNKKKYDDIPQILIIGIVLLLSSILVY